MTDGNIQAFLWKKRIMVAGDPAGLRSLAKLLSWLADLDQESIPQMPEGERAHVHLYAGSQISADSSELELCRLDAKGTGAFPRGFDGRDEKTRGVGCPEWFLDRPDA
jgi:hypothetical protein